MNPIGESLNPNDKEKLKELVDSGALSTVETEVYRFKYYSEKLGLKDNIEENIEKLYDFYMERIGDKSSAQAVKETIHEYITLFELRNLDGPEIVAHKIAMVGRKGDPGKKNLSYLIGCLRNVLEYGLSSTNGNTEKRLITSFENKYGLRLSPTGRQRLLSIAANYSTVEVLFSIIEREINIEGVFLDIFERSLASGSN